MQDTFIDDLLLNLGWNINDQRCCDAIMSSRLDYAAIMERHCPFCDPTRLTVIWENEYVRAMLDGFPVTEGHCLIAPRRHIERFDELTDIERAELMKAVAQVWPSVRGLATDFNLGMNDGRLAGQTVPHVHLHLIPRRFGDIHDPTGGVRGVIPDRRDWKRFRQYPPPPARGLLAGSPHEALETELLLAFDDAVTVDMAVAFLSKSGIDIIEEQCRDVLARPLARIRIISGDYLGFNAPQDLRRLLGFGTQLELWVYETNAKAGFHAKSYMFKDEAGRKTAFVGSSNLTARALQSNVEWNIRIDDHTNASTVTSAENSFERLLGHPAVKRVTHDWINAYEERRFQQLKSGKNPRPEIEGEEPPTAIQAHSVQSEALAALRAARSRGETAGLVVMATGLGKTILAALHRTELAYPRCLFIAHREEILNQAIDAFRRVDPNMRASRVDGNGEDFSGTTVFASIQTLSRGGRVKQLAADHFDLIVVDEFHHAAAPSYRRVISHFAPEYLLGLTATPDRTDQGDILALCNDKLVYGCDLFAGIDRFLLSPFDYFGIADLIEYEQIPWRNGKFDPTTLDHALASQSRAKRALDEWAQQIGRSRPTLAFCASVAHANFMREYCTRHFPLVRCAAVHNGPDSNLRAKSLEQLKHGSLDILFSVDMFNEGVDIPAIGGILMLRPTTSPIIFLQQLGRGLRFQKDKRLKVVDFVGNHRAFLSHLMTVLDLDDPAQIAPRLKEGMDNDGLFVLPSGCRIQYELSAIDFLQQAGTARKTRERLEDWYQAHCELTGSRPSFREAMAKEFYGTGGTATNHTMRSWAAVLARNDTLPTLLGDEHSTAREVLDIIQTTPMTRSFKMLVLEVFAEELLPATLSIDRIGQHFKNRAKQDARIARDITCDLTDDRALHQYLLKNPIQAWTTTNKDVPIPLFITSASGIALNRNIPSETKPVLANSMLELIEAKLWSYFNRSSKAG